MTGVSRTSGRDDDAVGEVGEVGDSQQASAEAIAPDPATAPKQRSAVKLERHRDVGPSQGIAQRKAEAWSPAPWW